MGGSVGGASSQQQADEKFVPHAIAPNPAIAEMRDTCRAALTALGEKLETLLETADNEAEKDFWLAALERQKEGI